jgi:hypothetical protein
VWDLSSRDLIRTATFDDGLNGAVFLSNGDLALCSDVNVISYNFLNDTEGKVISFVSTPMSVDFSVGENRIVVGCQNGMCYVYEADGWRYVAQFCTGPRGKPLSRATAAVSVRYAVDRIFVLNRDRRIRQFSALDFSFLKKFYGEGIGAVRSRIELSEDGATLMVIGERGGVGLWPTDHQDQNARKGEKVVESEAREGFTFGRDNLVRAAIFLGDFSIIVADSKGTLCELTDMNKL